MITPTASFKENLSLLPAIDGIARIELKDAAGQLVGSIENQPGKQGSLAVYNHLFLSFGSLSAEAAAYGIALFAEHSADTRPGAHPNIDRLRAIVNGAPALTIAVITA